MLATQIVRKLCLWVGERVRKRHARSEAIFRGGDIVVDTIAGKNCPPSLVTDPLQRVVMVVKDHAAREAPLAAVVFDQLAPVVAGRKATVPAVL